MKRRILVTLLLAWVMQPLVSFATPTKTTEGDPFPVIQKSIELIKPLPQTNFAEAKTVEAVYVAPKPAAAPVSAPSGDKASWLAGAGISPSDYGYVDYIVSRESSWCPTRWQGQSFCPDNYYATLSLSDGWVGYGLCQSTPGIKMASAGADYTTNGVTQLRWCNNYAMDRYGSWAAAYNYWVAHHNW